MRRKYLDNIRWFIILLVLIDHTVCIFSSCKSPMSYNTTGIEALDAIGYMIYPWFMPCLFVVAGMSAKYALEKKEKKVFLKERVWKLLIPFITYVLLIGPFASALSFKVNNLNEAFAALPAGVIVAIRLVSGMGPSWFLLQLFLITLVWLLIMKLDSKDKLMQMGEMCNIWSLLILYLPVVLSAQILYISKTFRNGLYLFLFLLGYYVFSHEKVQELCKKYALYFLGAGLVVGGVQTYLYWGKVYQDIVNKWVVVLYTWLMILAVLGCFYKFFNKSNKMTDYLSQNSFGIYLCHYVPMVYLAFWLDTKCHLPKGIEYMVTCLGAFAMALLLTAVIRCIPLLNQLLGLRKHKINKI